MHRPRRLLLASYPSVHFLAAPASCDGFQIHLNHSSLSNRLSPPLPHRSPLCSQIHIAGEATQSPPAPTWALTSPPAPTLPLQLLKLLGQPLLQLPTLHHAGPDPAAAFPLSSGSTATAIPSSGSTAAASTSRDLKLEHVVPWIQLGEKEKE